MMNVAVDIPRCARCGALIGEARRVDFLRRDLNTHLGSIHYACLYTWGQRLRRWLRDRLSGS
jgi:hypothetical protein